MKMVPVWHHSLRTISLDKWFSSLAARYKYLLVKSKEKIILQVTPQATFQKL